MKPSEANKGGRKLALRIAQQATDRDRNVMLQWLLKLRDARQSRMPKVRPGVATMTVAAGVLMCLVIGISDGDTLTARCDTPTGTQNIKVRLAQIDAPERHRAFGSRSRQHLASKHPHGSDAMGRHRRHNVRF